MTVGFFLACWIVFLLDVAGVTELAGLLPLALYPLYSAASAIGWGAGMVYVQLTRKMPKPERRPYFLWSFFTPPGLLFMLRAMAPESFHRAAPLVPFLAFCVYAIIYVVPIAMRNVPRPPQ